MLSKYELTITQAQEKLKTQGKDIWNITALERETGISRPTLRKYRDGGFKAHGNKGKRKLDTLIFPYEQLIDEMIKGGNGNAHSIFRELKMFNYTGSLSTVKNYVYPRKYLLPNVVRNTKVSPGNRGRRYKMNSGECFQMDWGFVKVKDENGKEHQFSIFVMVCAFCSKRYIEFFTNAKQENLFIGMIHGFKYLGGIPEKIMTDNMASVVTKHQGKEPIWNKNYKEFMAIFGFKTILNKCRHPFTKGRVERAVRYVKTSFIPNRTFSHLGDLNNQAIQWCDDANKLPHTITKEIPNKIHSKEKFAIAFPFDEVMFEYLAVKRDIAFDGCLNYEGYRYGTPFTYNLKHAYVMRNGSIVTIYGVDRKLIATHNLDWITREYFLDNQWEIKDAYLSSQPEEEPTSPIKCNTLKLKRSKRIEENDYDLSIYDSINDNIFDLEDV